MTVHHLRKSLGGGIDGVAQEYFVCDEQEVVHMPSTFDFREGASLTVCLYFLFLTGPS